MTELQLQPGAFSDLASDSAPQFPVLRVSGAAPRVELVGASGENVGLAPGEYLFEVRLRVLEGDVTPTLRAGGVAQPLHKLAGVWRCVLNLNRSTDRLELTFASSGQFVFVDARIVTEAQTAERTPTLGASLVIVGRALFRKLPGPMRRAVLGSRRRAEWLGRVRGDGGAEPANANAGRFVVGGDGDGAALRADFGDRFGVARGLKNAGYEESAPDATPASPDGVKLVAFYLPQFHPIPENDAWWGRGFTEWTNVAKAAPQFQGHYQPRLPGELGFYDLRTPGILSRQAELARAHGVGAFCFHYYWFAGKRLLEAPLDAFLADCSIDIEFCLCWANENWTRRWDGAEKEILIGQRHSAEDHARVFDDLARYAEDPRYMRIDGKPLIVVYRPAIIDDVRGMIALWRAAAEKRGWPGVFFVATTAFRFKEAAEYGFDALVEFPPHGFVADGIRSQLRWLNPDHSGEVYDYEKVANEEVRRMDGAREKNVFPGVMPGWDNEARTPGRGVVYHGASPAAYGAWLRAAIERAKRNLPSDRRLVFINAWNEWAEGAYIEPDRAFGSAYLAETARALSNLGA